GLFFGKQIVIAFPEEFGGREAGQFLARPVPEYVLKPNRFLDKNRQGQVRQNGVEKKLHGQPIFPIRFAFEPFGRSLTPVPGRARFNEDHIRTFLESPGPDPANLIDTTNTSTRVKANLLLCFSECSHAAFFRLIRTGLAAHWGPLRSTPPPDTRSNTFFGALRRSGSGNARSF